MRAHRGGGAVCAGGQAGAQGGRARALAGAAALALAALGAAQAPGSPAAAPPAAIVLQPRYRAGATYAWRLHVHSVLRRDQSGQTAGASLDNRAIVVLRIVSAPARPNPATPVLAEVRFRQYQTEVSGFGGFAAALRAAAGATDQAVLRMHPAEVRLIPGGGVQWVRSGTPPAPRQAQTMLRQLLSAAGLPLGAVRVGDHWQRQEIQKLPQFDDSFPLQVEAWFTGWRTAPGGAWRAEITSRSQASVILPPGAIPGFSAAAAAGWASQARLRIDGQATSGYGINGILERARSHTRTWLHIARIGGIGVRPPAAAATDLRVDSTGSVQRLAPK